MQPDAALCAAACPVDQLNGRRCQSLTTAGHRTANDCFATEKYCSSLVSAVHQPGALHCTAISWSMAGSSVQGLETLGHHDAARS